MFLKLDNKY